MNPTDEQQQAIDLFSTGQHLGIQAGAGTGKTSTLRMIGADSDLPGHYMAFNRSIVDEAKRKMPSNVTASTVHSLAYRAVGRRFEHRLKGGRQPSRMVADRLGIRHLVLDLRMGKKVLQPGFLAGHVQRAITRFCQSAALEPGPEHFPWIDGIDERVGGRRESKNNELVAEAMTEHLRTAWADLQTVDGVLRFTHDHYVKLWELGDPIVPGRFLLVDEAQDLSPVMLSIAEKQRARGSQLVFVGDSQQQIYEWRGAIDALSQLPAEHTTYLTRSWRFGDAIAEVANLVLNWLDAPLRLEGNPAVESYLDRLTEPDAVLTRTNATAVETLLRYQRGGAATHLIGGGDEVFRFVEAAQQLMVEGSTWHPELACFDSWKQVQEYVENDPQGDELKLMVDLIDEFGVQPILDALGRMPKEHEAQIVVSTAHKAKGREWDRVKLTHDFGVELTDQLADSAGEWRLLYVAATRARQVLDVESCTPLCELLNAPSLSTSWADTLLGR